MVNKKKGNNDLTVALDIGTSDGDITQVSIAGTILTLEQLLEVGTTPIPAIDYTERVEIVPYYDGWSEYEEAVFEFQKA